MRCFRLAAHRDRSRARRRVAPEVMTIPARYESTHDAGVRVGTTVSWPVRVR